MRELILLVAIGALALLLRLGSEPEPFEPLPRGLSGELLSFEVQGASRPGARCKVELRGLPDLWVSLPAQPCLWSAGDRIELPGASVRRWKQRPSRHRVLWVSHYVGHKRSRGGFWEALAKWRVWLFVHCGKDPGANFVLASLSGMPQVLRWKRLTWLRQAGLGHLTAVSGLHVGTLAQVVFWTLMRVMGAFRWSRRPGACVDFAHLLAVLACTVPVLAFVMATGAAASACRALLCWGTFALAASFGLHLHRLSVLAWIAIGMLAFRPAWWGDPGFCFSFVATAVLLWPRPSSFERSFLAGPQTLGIWRSRAQALLAQSSWSTSWQLCWALAPLSLWFFGTSSMVSVFANLVAIPVFAGWVLPLGLLAVGLAALSEFFGCAQLCFGLVANLFYLAGWGGALILDTARFFSRVSPGGPWQWSLLSVWLLVIYPTREHLSPLHPLAFAPKSLLWVLVGAPLWVF